MKILEFNEEFGSQSRRIFGQSVEVTMELQLPDLWPPNEVVAPSDSLSHAKGRSAAMIQYIDPELPPPVVERLTFLNQHPEIVTARSAHIRNSCSVPIRDNLIKQAAISTTAAKRVTWLRREAEHVQRASEGQSACHAGCSSCCHMGVQLTDTEARVIGREIGVVPAQPPDDISLVPADVLGDEQGQEKNSRLVQEFVGTPCPFLDESGLCRIYASRPIACRHLLNLDRDDLLCRLIEGKSVPVPYLNMTASTVAYAMVMGSNNRLADIRHFFPEGLSKSGK